MTTKDADIKVHIPAFDHDEIRDYCQIDLGGKPMSRFIRGLIRRNVPELREKYTRLAERRALSKSKSKPKSK